MRKRRALFFSGGVYVPCILLAYEMGVTELEATQVLVVARCLCDVFRALINSLVYWFDENTKTHITRYALQASGSVSSMSDLYLKEETIALYMKTMVTI